MFMDVAMMYMNYFSKLKMNLALKVVEKPTTYIYYKKSTRWHKAGDVKEVIQHKHWTPFTKLLKALVFNDDVSRLNDSLKAQYDYYAKKFGSQRIDSLVSLVKDNLLKKIHKIEFKTGTWRCCYSHNGKSISSCRFVDETNALYKHWMKIDLRKEFEDIYLPLQINEDYHDLSKS